MEKVAKGAWEPNIQKLPIKISEEDTAEIPVFAWSYKVGEMYGGDVKAWPHLGYFTFQTRRHDFHKEPLKVNEASNLVKFIEEFGWGIPPHLSELEADIKKTREIAKQGDAQAFLAECKKLEERWKQYT